MSQYIDTCEQLLTNFNLYGMNVLRAYYEKLRHLRSYYLKKHSHHFYNRETPVPSRTQFHSQLFYRPASSIGQNRVSRYFFRVSCSEPSLPKRDTVREHYNEMPSAACLVCFTLLRYSVHSIVCRRLGPRRPIMATFFQTLLLMTLFERRSLAGNNGSADNGTN